MNLPQWLVKLILRQRHGLAVHVGKVIINGSDKHTTHYMECVCGWRTYWHRSEAEAAAEFRQHARN